jgi:hypothetical protein
MKYLSRSFVAACLPLSVLLPMTASASCGAAFCPVNTQWEVQGAWQQPGFRVDLRYEFLDQDQPRHGSERIAVGEISGHHDEVRTLNRNVLVNLDYAFDDRWGVSLTLPRVDRDHVHIHHHHGDVLNESWNISGLGDAKLLGRYRLQEQPVSLLFGMKLPTGATDVTNETGALAERTLQAGTGTTDLVFGIAWQHGEITSPWSWFAQAMGQRALDSHDDFRSGNLFTLDGGVRYMATSKLSLMAQANAVVKGRDRGAEAETELSGGEYLFLTPGMSYALSRDVQFHAFVQQPLHQHVNGVQLTANIGYTAGISARF